MLATTTAHLEGEPYPMWQRWGQEHGSSVVPDGSVTIEGVVPPEVARGRRHPFSASSAALPPTQE
eukprot:1652126-Pyramimonas_sp.AAC.1